MWDFLIKYGNRGLGIEHCVNNIHNLVNLHKQLFKIRIYWRVAIYNLVNYAMRLDKELDVVNVINLIQEIRVNFYN